MRKKIKNIIDAKGDADPIERLGTLYKSLLSAKEREEFMNIIWRMIKLGDARERRLSLALIGHLHMASIYRNEIQEYIQEYRYDSDKLLLIKLLDLCGSLDDLWAVEFIRYVMRNAKRKKDWEVYILAIRVSVQTSEWEYAIHDLFENIDSLDDDVIVDLFAYFHWVRPDKPIDQLGMAFGFEAGKKLTFLNNRIMGRYRDNYAHFSYQRNI